MLKHRLFIVIFLLAGGISAQVNRTIDGFGNNMDHPEWGATGSVMPTLVSNGFADGASLPGGAFRPNARVISNEIFQQDQSIQDLRNLSELVWVFGQFIDHDISLVAKNPGEYIGIKIPNNDQYFTPGSQIHFSRSLPVPGTGLSEANPRLYTNEITSFVDGSNIYGSDPERAAWLRTFEGGKLKVSAGDLLPWNTFGNHFNDLVDPDAPSMDDDTGISPKLFVAGDVRANENPLLLSLHVVFVREHNRICDELTLKYPHWSDEILYEQARKRVGALLQSVLYNEWLPALGIQLPDYSGYDPDINPGVLNEFSASAFRLGHTLLTDDIVRLDLSGDTLVQGNIELKDAFFNPTAISLAGGVEPYLTGVASRSQQLLDCKIVNDARNFLFGAPGSGGLDLVALNIMRGRDRGLPDYNTLRANFGLEPFTGMAELTDDADLVDQLIFLYGNINNIDPWVGMLAEKHLTDKMFGELLYVILYRQFLSLRDGDRYYFENDAAFTNEELIEISNTGLAEIIIRNTDIDRLQKNVFYIEKKEPVKDGPELARTHLDAVAYPNPVSDRLYIKYYLSHPATVSLTVLNHLGQTIQKTSWKGTEGDNLGSLDLDLPTGFYQFLVQASGQFRIFRVRVEK